MYIFYILYNRYGKFYTVIQFYKLWMGEGGEVFHFAKFNFTLTKFFLKNFLGIIAIRNLTDKNSCLLVVYSGYNLATSLSFFLSGGKRDLK